MKKNRWFRYLLLTAIVFLLVIGLSVTYGGTLNNPNPTSNEINSIEGATKGEDEFSKLLSSTLKKETDIQIRTTTAQDQTNELRYLILGNMDQEISLIVKLVDKAKGGIINSQALTQFLRQRQTRNNKNPSLQKQIDNLIYELCILDMGRSTRRDMLNYINRIDYDDSGFNIMLDSDINIFKSILDLIRYNVVSSIEAVDALIILKTKMRSN